VLPQWARRPPRVAVAAAVMTAMTMAAVTAPAYRRHDRYDRHDWNHRYHELNRIRPLDRGPNNPLGWLGGFFMGSIPLL